MGILEVVEEAVKDVLEEVLVDVVEAACPPVTVIAKVADGGLADCLEQLANVGD